MYTTSDSNSTSTFNIISSSFLNNRAYSNIKIRIFTHRSVSLLASFSTEAGRTAAVRLGYVVVVVVLVTAAVGAAHVRLALAHLLPVMGELDVVDVYPLLLLCSSWWS